MRTNIKQNLFNSKVLLFGLGLSILTTSCGKSNNDPDASGTFEATEVIVFGSGSRPDLGVECRRRTIAYC